MGISRGSLANQISKPPQKRKFKKIRKLKKQKSEKCLKMHAITKLKARYRVFPSAYASGAIAKCRKVGAANYGTGGKKRKKARRSTRSKTKTSF